MEDLNQIFSENLKRIRIQRGMTQGELGSAINYSNKAVSKWESGVGMPSIDVLLQISEILNVDLNALIYKENPTYYLGIDGGGTKTAFALADSQGNIIRTAKHLSCNPVDIGISQSQAILRDGIDEILRDIPRSCVSLFAGIAGAASGENREILEAFFHSFGFASSQNQGDVQNAIAIGLQGEEGVLGIVGTGSVVYAVSEQKQHRIGGYGYLFGECGAGYDIGNCGIKASFAATDGSGPETILRQMVEQKSGSSFPDNLSVIYKGGKSYVASFAPLVLDAYAQGDTVAEQILRDCTQRLSVQLVAAAQMVSPTAPIVLAGGLIQKSESLLSILKQCLPAGVAKRIRVCQDEPYLGALLLAGAPMGKGEKSC